jgi:predicted DNA-binding transcriptional regulator AlpA
MRPRKGYFVRKGYLGGLITRNEAAALCRMSLRTFGKRMKEPGFPASIRLTPGRILLRESDVRAWINRQAAAGNRKDPE